MTLFELLVKVTKETEDKEFCPLVVYGTFFNTSRRTDGTIIIDFEEMGINGTADFLYDEEDLTDFLKRRRIKPENFKKAVEKADRQTAIKLLTN